MQIVRDPGPWWYQIEQIHIGELPGNHNGIWANHRLPNEPSDFMLVAVDDGTAVGYLFGEWYHELVIQEMAVRRDRKGEGIGTALLCEAASLAAERGDVGLVLVRPIMPDLEFFYRTRGFIDEGPQGHLQGAVEAVRQACTP